MKNTFKSNEKFNTYLHLQRHECRQKRQKIRSYGMKEMYQELLNQFHLFEKYIPTGTKCVLDIGCGLGYIDVILSRHIPDLNLYMFDSLLETNNKVNLFYNDLSLTKEFLILNDVNPEKIFLINATATGNDQIINLDPNCFKTLPKIDFVISLYAWGWHSRLPKFIKEVYEVLREGGRFIIEIKGNVNDDSENLTCLKTNNFRYIESIQIFKGRYLLIAEKIKPI
jgi:SAM-dependent methyltransferase